MDTVSFTLNDAVLNDDSMNNSTGYVSVAEDIVQQNYSRFIVSGLTMGALSKLMWGDSVNISVQKALYMGLSTLLSDLLLGMAIKTGYLSNSSSTPSFMLGQVALESFLYFPIASRGQVIVPDVTGNAFKQTVLSSGVSQGAQYFMTPKQSS